MATSERLYLVKPDGDVWRIPNRLYAGLRDGRMALPEHAGTKQRVVSLLVEFENRKPQAILSAMGKVWTFDADGRIDAALQQEVRRAVDLFPGALGNDMPTNVADARQAFMSKKFDNELRWSVPDDLIWVLAEDLGMEMPA